MYFFLFDLNGGRSSHAHLSPFGTLGYGGRQVQTRNNGQKRIHKQETAANNEMKYKQILKTNTTKKRCIYRKMQTKYNTQTPKTNATEKVTFEHLINAFQLFPFQLCSKIFDSN